AMLLLGVELDERRDPPQAERAAALHPECGVGERDRRFGVAILESRDQLADRLLLDERAHGLHLLPRQRPEALAEREPAIAADALVEQPLRCPLHGALHDD